MTESLAWTLSLCLLGSYLVGAIPVGLLLGKMRGVDLREIGSGNIGATNAARALGKKLGIAVFFIDVLKAAAPVFVCKQLPAVYSDANATIWLSAIATAAFLGHVYPIYLKFRGGKGVACALGAFSVLTPHAAIASMVLYLQTLWLSRVSAIGSLTGVSTMTLFIWLTPQPWPYRVTVVLHGSLIWWRHRSNLRELRAPRAA